MSHVPEPTHHLVLHTVHIYIQSIVSKKHLDSNPAGKAKRRTNWQTNGEKTFEDGGDIVFPE